MDHNGGKVDIWHGEPCRCWTDKYGAIYVGPECIRLGHRVTKHRLAQLRHKLRNK